MTNHRRARFSLLPSLFAAGFALLGGSAWANPDYEEGLALLQEKKGKEAITAFARCISSEPADSEQLIDCHWESGWAYWIDGDWAGAVRHWEVVEKVQPDRDGLTRFLSQARDNLSLDALLAKSRDSVPATFASEVPPGTTLRLRAVGDLMIGTDFPAGVLP